MRHRHVQSFVWSLVLLIGFWTSSGAAETCRTLSLPGPDGVGGSVSIPAGGAMMIRYSPPPEATRVGLEFWFHAFPYYTYSTPDQYILVYLSEWDGQGRRLFHIQNDYPYDKPQMFPLSTWIHPGELFQVGWLNNTEFDLNGYLIVTLRECRP